MTNLIDRDEVIKYIESISHPCQIPEIVKKINNLPIESQWIPVSDKYPPDNTYVLAIIGHNQNVVHGYASELGEWLWDSTLNYTHWQPLHPPPITK